MLVTASDLEAGHELTEDDVRVASAPAGLVPSGALTSMDSALGRILTSATRSGEPITDTRLIGADGAGLSGHPDEAAVPIRLGDTGIAELLHPGATVDVVTLDSADDGRQIVAREATVVTITSGSGEGLVPAADGPLVLVAVPADTASDVAALSLHQPVTVTLR